MSTASQQRLSLKHSVVQKLQGEKKGKVLWRVNSKVRGKGEMVATHAKRQRRDDDFNGPFGLPVAIWCNFFFD